MEKFLVCFFLLAVIVVLEVHATRESYQQQQKNGRRKLFVFGDSYVDTGNTPKFLANSWKEPYGITFPGKPSGRFSDGHILTDYIASFLGIGSPLPYQSWKSGGKSIQDGINFAHGGSGVFNTIYFQPNMTTQIDYFQQAIKQKIYSKQDLNSSIALVSLAGNDYATYLSQNGTLLVSG
ncbi:unnamed protein product [Ilex paraguariensis]|uniref:GDSL esterase/lipase n=1 Tax=Ilex paraguariensis TaxID=185542 RepID=A0ABC8V4Q3_9AQUA